MSLFGTRKHLEILIKMHEPLGVNSSHKFLFIGAEYVVIVTENLFNYHI